MPPNDPESDRVRLIHMLWAARQARGFAEGRGRDDLDADAMFRRATVSCIQEIGEAASKVSESTRSAVPSLPWRQIVGMRHQVVHAYFQVNHGMVWQVVEHDLPPLIAAIEAYVPDAPDEPTEAP